MCYVTTQVLGDQAVADPSKVEAKVMQQIQQRQMNHEMRNQAAKLTPGMCLCSYSISRVLIMSHALIS